jgi:hypothetical protein
MSRKAANESAVLIAILTYNLLVAMYLASLGFGGESVGILLWPAIAIHAVLTLLFGCVRFIDQQPNHHTLG